MALTPDFDSFAQAYEAGEHQVVYTRLAADLDTPVSIMLKLAGARTDSFILESVTGGEVLDANNNPIIVEHWLAVVPTLTRVKVRDPQKGIMRELEEGSYTVAISEKGSGKWTFLTGMKPTVKDLRGMFPTLPKDEKALGLPKGSVREIK